MNRENKKILRATTFILLTFVIISSFLAQESKSTELFLGNNPAVSLPIFPHRTSTPNEILDFDPASITVFHKGKDVTLLSKRESGLYQVRLKIAAVAAEYENKTFRMYFWKGEKHEVEFTNFRNLILGIGL